MEDAGDVAWVGHNIEDVHAAAALAADGDGDGEDAGQQVGPADAARSGGPDLLRRSSGPGQPAEAVLADELARLLGDDVSLQLGEVLRVGGEHRVPAVGHAAVELLIALAEFGCTRQLGHQRQQRVEREADVGAAGGRERCVFEGESHGRILGARVQLCDLSGGVVTSRGVGDGSPPPQAITHRHDPIEPRRWAQAKRFTNRAYTVGQDACLIVLQGARPGRRHDLHGEQKIGRVEDSDVRVDETAVSRVHAILITDGSGVRLRGNGSTNGTYVATRLHQPAKRWADSREFWGLAGV